MSVYRIDIGGKTVGTFKTEPTKREFFPGESAKNAENTIDLWAYMNSEARKFERESPETRAAAETRARVKAATMKKNPPRGEKAFLGDISGSRILAAIFAARGNEYTEPGSARRIAEKMEAESPEESVEDPRR